MFFSFEFPFLDIRQFMDSETYMLPFYQGIDLPVFSDGEFVRSFGAIKERENSREICEKIYCMANHAVKLHPQNIISFHENRKFVPRCIFKRFFSNGINCRVDIGIENCLTSQYDEKEIGTIAKHLFYSRLLVPQRPVQTVNHYEITMEELGKRLANLYLHATTKLPRQNFSLVSKNWIVHANPMVLIEARQNDILPISQAYEKIILPELKSWDIELYYKADTSICPQYFMKQWLLISSDKTPKDIVRNVRIYLLKMHEERECFMQVIKKFGYEINQDTFDKNGMLNRYIENFIYSSLLKKKKYGISNNALYEIINKIDNCINQDQINQLLDYFSSARIRKIKESGEDTVKDVVNCVTINGSMINSQVATQGSTIDSTVLGNQTVSHDSELLSKIIAAQSELPKFYNQLKPDQYQKIQKNLLALHRDISDHKLTERKKWNIRKYLETLSDLAGIGGFLMAVVKML